MEEIQTEDVKKFLEGSEKWQRVTNVECNYTSDYALVFMRTEDGKKISEKVAVKPFAWAKRSACIRLFGGNRRTLKQKMQEYGIKIKSLRVSNDGTNVASEERLENGYRFFFYTERKMSHAVFSSFFSEAGVPLREKSVRKVSDEENIKSQEYIVLSPVEQVMMSERMRMFSGLSNYNDVKRLIFDIETKGLNPKNSAIEQIGVRTNRGRKQVFKVEGNNEIELKLSELEAIRTFLDVINEEDPDVIVGYNSENFDWDFFEKRCEVLGVSFATLSAQVLGNSIRKSKRPTILKLGSEVETFFPTKLYGCTILDGLHAVRRAQASDSSIKKANLKYITKYMNLNKPNRVYVPGDRITEVWNDKEKNYAMNSDNGDWYKLGGDKKLEDGYEMVSGEHVVEEYLLDDLYETDKVEEKLNEANFLVNQMLPTTFNRAATMGTAGVWKLIMFGWAYEQGLAIPSMCKREKFTGGLSRLLKTGYVNRIVKLDYNSLYPSIILTWGITTPLDLLNVMTKILEFILTMREKYKGLKAEAGDNSCKAKEQLENMLNEKFGISNEEILKLKEQIKYWKSEKTSNDKKQLPLKTLANSFFGSYGAPHLYPFGDIKSAEKTTCIGRMALRLMIAHFTKLNYIPIVGDTDGFNFSYPPLSELRYNAEHPYISNGEGRNSVKGKAYVGIEADVCEFEDIYFNKPYSPNGINKMGLGIDEYCTACVQFSRKNYADLMPDGTIKKVGNTIKSRQMQGYLEKFIDEGVELLLHGNGAQFLRNYYNYIERIYNYQIPVRDIASKGKVKKTLAEYKKDCQGKTKDGSKKSRQVWYELAIKEGLNPNISDSIYYINTGDSKSESDVKRITHKFVKIDGQEIELKGKVVTQMLRQICEEKNLDVKMLKAKDRRELLAPLVVREEDEIVVNAQMVPQEIINSDKDIMCNELEDLGYEPIEYNVPKYIAQFCTRVSPLLVCFSKDIREKILIDNPKNKKYWTEEESTLVSGEPVKECDQDKYEVLMTPEKKEIEFWTKIGEIPPFVKECGIDWEKLVKKYEDEKKTEENKEYKHLDSMYLEALSELTEKDVETFETEGKLPASISKIMVLDSDMYLRFADMPTASPSTGGYVFDDIRIN